MPEALALLYRHPLTLCHDEGYCKGSLIGQPALEWWQSSVQLILLLYHTMEVWVAPAVDASEKRHMWRSVKDCMLCFKPAPLVE